ncbi:hypothetical protein GCM10028862_22140 [Luteimonas pelagia]
MAIRAMPAGAGLGWLKHAVNLGRSNARAIFGGAALLLVAVFVVALGVSLLMGGVAAATSPGTTGMMAISLLTILPLMLVMAMLMVGYLRLIDAVEHGRPARALDVLGGFRDTTTSLRAIGFILLVTIVQNLLVAGVVAVLAPEVGSWYLETLQASVPGQAPPDATPPQGFGLVFVAMVVLGLFFYALQAVGLGQVALRGRGVVEAFVDGFSGALRNLLPLLVFGVVMLLAVVAFALVGALLAAVIALLGKAVGAWIVVVLGAPLYVAVIVAVIVVMFGVMYYLWRDVAGDGAGTDDGAVAA